MEYSSHGRPARPGSQPTAATTRRKRLARVVADKAVVAGCHFPFPAAGAIAKDGSGYAFTPA
jgi:hypothetical protein